MTNQEAAEIIRNGMKLYHDYLSGEFRKALRMAISALREQELKQEVKQEVNNSTESSLTQNGLDTISRQAAIETARTMYERCDTLDMLDYCNLMLTALKELPSAQPEREYTMEEFMFGQDMGNPEDGSL